jgi:hypothetical protein
MHGLSREAFSDLQGGAALDCESWQRFGADSAFASIWVYDFGWPPSQGAVAIKAERTRRTALAGMRQNIGP